MLKSRDDAYRLLHELNAPRRLLVHVQLVGEAGEVILGQCRDLNVDVDEEFVRIGIAIHDVGKIVHAHEITGPGSDHEPEGEKMLVERGVSARISRCCLSHARWDRMECSIEELLIALADKLWKGKRVEALELLVIDRIAGQLGKDRWDLFSELDFKFEEIALSGHEKLQRSINT